MKRNSHMSLAALLRFGAMLIALWSGAPAGAVPGWIEVSSAPVYTQNCVTGYSEPLGLASIAYFADQSAPTQVNSVYYSRIWWSVSGRPCAGARVSPELFLPDGTTLAISAAMPVRCYAVNLSTRAKTPETTACPQAPVTGVHGGLAFNPTGNWIAWPTPPGTAWEIDVPLLSTTPLSGAVTSNDPTAACASCLTAAVYFIDGVADPTATARVGVVIGGPASAPSVTYPSPSATNITDTSARLTGYLSRQGTTGNVFFQYSVMPIVSSTCTASPGTTMAVTTATPPSTSYWIDIAQIVPATDLYWRMCYTAANMTYVGATQLFHTTGPAPSITSLSPLTALPGRTVKITGDNLAGATSVQFNGSHDNVSAAITAQSATAITFTVPNVAFQAGTFIVNTPVGTATSGNFNIGIDTILDSTRVTIVNGSRNLTIHYHSTEPAPSVQYDCQMIGDPLAKTCDAGVVTYNGLSTGVLYQIQITAHAGAFRDPSPLIVRTLLHPNFFAAPASHETISGLPGSAEAAFECGGGAESGVTVCASTESVKAYPAAMRALVLGAGRSDERSSSARRASTPVEADSFGTTLVADSLGSDAATTSRTVSFAFASTRGTGFECSLDYGAWFSCKGEVTLTDLTPGAHTFLARAVDDSGAVDLLPATKSWFIE